MSTRRQFIIAPALARLIQGERGGERVLEGYFPDQQSRNVHVQVEETRSSLIFLHSSEDPVEERTDIPPPQAQALLAVTVGQVEYIRTTLRISSNEIQIQHFISPCPLDLASFEVDENTQELQPLPWFGPEVSGNAAYLRRRIALAGLSVAPEVELTDEALNSLLDGLENGPTSGPSPHDATASQMTAPDQSAASGPAEPATPTDDDGDADDLGIEDSVIRELARSLRPHSRA